MSDWLNRCHFGDVRAVLRQMAADGVQVHTIVTSPPYWGLRSYLPEGHADKALEIGSEPTIGEFIATMVEVFDLCRQVLREDGTMWVNMGDSYAGSHGGGAPSASSTLRGNGHIGGGPKRQKLIPSQRRADAPAPQSVLRQPGLKPKDLVGQPWRLAFALQDAGWWLRQDIIWHKPNPMPESIRDRCTKAHEYIFLLSKSDRYYFDQGAIRTPLAPKTTDQSFETFDGDRRAEYKAPAGWATSGTHSAADWAVSAKQGRGSKRNSFARETKNTAGEHGQKPQHRPDRAEVHYANSANKRSVWTVATEAYPGSHFATFPRALVEPCVLAGAPAGGTVLDIFFGSGTTGQVAQALGRNFIGIDINPANAPLQADRLRQPSLLLEAA